MTGPWISSPNSYGATFPCCPFLLKGTYLKTYTPLARQCVRARAANQSSYPIRTYVHTDTYIHSKSNTHIYTRTHTCSFLPQTAMAFTGRRPHEHHPHTRPHTPIHSHTHTHSHTHKLTHTRPHTLEHTLTHSLTHKLTHIHTHIGTHTLKHTHTHTHIVPGW